MSTYSEKTTFYAYEDQHGKLVTSLFESQGAATSDLYSFFERQVKGIEWKDFTNGGSYSANFRAYREAVRAAAKKLADAEPLRLVTFRLERNASAA